MDPYLQFAKDFHAYTGIDLLLYKRPQMERRLTSLRNKHGYADFASFFAAIRQNARLLDEVLDKMTINVSEFMRNGERWEALIPHLRRLAKSGPLKAWSAACSTGEEPYTLAMLIEEQLHVPYEILATDIDQRVLKQAELGQYKEHQVRGLATALLDKYFRREGQTWKVDHRLQRHVTFRQHNLLADPYPKSLNLIICRNVLIYFTDQAKEHVIRGFADSLETGGLLFVGSTEQFLSAGRYGFAAVGPFLYQKRGRLS